MSTITNVPNDPQGEYAFVGDPITAEDYRAAYRSLRVRFWDAKLRVEQLEAAAACQQTAEQLIIERREEDIEELQRQVKMLGERVQELESPPVVPEGSSVARIGDTWFASGIGLLPPGCDHRVVRALAWAIEHNENPTHASDQPLPGDEAAEEQDHA